MVGESSAFSSCSVAFFIQQKRGLDLRDRRYLLGESPPQIYHLSDEKKQQQQQQQQQHGAVAEAAHYNLHERDLLLLHHGH